MALVNAVEVAASTKKNNGETLINVILDETGSMGRNITATISCFNEYLDSQKNLEGVCKVNFTTFSSVWEKDKKSVRTLFENKNISEVDKLSTENYSPNGGTNLYDAIMLSAKKVEEQFVGKDSVPNILFVILTDGEENSSREFTLADVKSMISEKEKEGWTFVYLAANQDAFAVGSTFGLSKGQTFSYNEANMGEVTKNLAVATSTYRSTRFSDATLSGTVSKDFFNEKE